MSWRASPSRPAPPVTSGAPSSSDPSSSTSSASSSTTSTTAPYDSLFAGSHPAVPSSSSSSRPLSSSSSAYSLLSRKMAQIEEADAAAAAASDDSDRASVRSSASRFTLRGGGGREAGSGGGSTVRGRSRAASGASSIRTVGAAPGARRWTEAAKDEDGDLKMGEAEGKGKSKAEDEDDDGSHSPGSAAKRARLRPPPASSPAHTAPLQPLFPSSPASSRTRDADSSSLRSRRSTPRLLSVPPTAAASSASSAGQATLSTTTAEDLMPHSSGLMRFPSAASSPRASRAPSIVSTRAGAGGAARRASLNVARPALEAARLGDSERTIKSAREGGTTPTPTPTPTATSSAAPPQPRATPTPAAESSTAAAANLNTRRSWFGRAPAAPAHPPPPPPAPQPQDAEAPLSASPPSEAALAPPPPAVPPSVPETDSSSSAAPPPPPAPEGAVDAPARGWLSLLSRSKASQVDLAAAAAGGGEGGEGRMEVDEPPEGGEQQGEGEVTPPATPKAPKDDDTLRGVPPRADSAQPAEDDTSSALTLTRQTALPPSRSSWFTWGRSSSTELVPGVPSTSPPDDASTIPAPTAGDENAEVPPSSSTSPTDQQQPDLESALTPSAAATTTAEQRGWLSLRALWGAAAGEGAAPSAEQIAEQRRREAWALKLAAKNSSQGLVTGRGQGQRLIEAVPEEGEAPVTAAPDEVDPAPTPTAPRELRHKPSSSWSLFSRTPLSGSSPVAKSTLSVRAPFISGLGVAGSSAASTRSRASSYAGGDTTAPSSPQLRPQSDQGPVKPLTGSIRTSSPRQHSTSTFDPSPPPPDNEPIGNLVLPSFNDTFLRPPRSFEPPKSTLTRAVSAVSAYLFHRPPDDAAPGGTPSLLQQAQAQAGVKTEGIAREMGGGLEDPAERLPKVGEAMGEPGGERLAKVKRVVTIGVHGWYIGNNMIKSWIGEQTGTSVKFATMMHDAVQNYLESHDISSFNIQAIALEGQGTVEERVNKLYNQLVARDEWVRAITMADAVFVATHSQGCVVSTQLLARMLDQGLIVGTQTHLLAMCGIAQGPFIYLYQSLALAPYFNYLESAPARELFEFQNPESVAAIKFTESLRVILNAGIKVTAIGSLNDQVVPLYSALFSGVDHPSIIRAIFIDSDAFLTSDFLANLTVFSARLRNAGLSDHDLIYHISEALAGALTGVGHSKIYEENAVFNLAVRYHFETTLLTDPPTHLDTQATPPPVALSFNPRDRRNPYLATWALRGIIEDPQVRQLFSKELVALQEAYETWKPQTKVLKDVKLKLEGIRMLAPRTGKL
ncbi:hypothetical protein JCM6882_006593 [Rhodosporidiobolus microsporus]